MAKTLCLPVSAWPDFDRTTWEKAQQCDDLFEDTSVAASWRPKTLEWVRIAYGYALDWLADIGQLDPNQPPTDRWPADVLRRYLSHLEGRGLRPASIRNRLTGLERALAVMDPDADREMLKTAIHNLTVPIDHELKRSRLQEPARLVDLGFELMANAEAGCRPSQRMDAALFRDGLQIALLAFRPLRISNFASLRIGQHLVRRPNGWWVKLDREETKTKQPMEVAISMQMLPALQRYLDVYRPLLGGDRDLGDRLWISYHFTPQTAHSIQLRMVEHTQRAFGKPINPHLFRDCAATSIAINDPVNVRMAAAILGHRTFATTQKHYNLARSMEASQAYTSFLRMRRCRSGHA